MKSPHITSVTKPQELLNVRFIAYPGTTRMPNVRANSQRQM